MRASSQRTNKENGKAKKEVAAVEVSGCSIAYGSDVVIDDVSFSIEQGSVAALIGPNGSGKTTLMKAVLGLVPIARGEVRVFGKHFHSVRDLIGYVPQKFDFDRTFPITVREFLDLARHRHTPKTRIADMVKEVGLLPRTLDAILGNLSGGQLQRVLIAQAILNNPKILFLDEPSSGVDIAGEATFYEIIEHLNIEHGTTVLMVSHDIGMVSTLVDNVICVNRKLLCYGPPHVALTERKLQELFGDRRTVYEHHEHPEDEGTGHHPH